MIYRTALQVDEHRAAVIPSIKPIPYEDVSRMTNLAYRYTAKENEARYTVETTNPYILDELAEIINQLTGAIIIYTYPLELMPLVNMVQRILEETYA